MGRAGDVPSSGMDEERDARGGRPRSFRDLRVWQEAIALARDVLAAVERLPVGHGALGDQAIRAATSVHANIAEGAGHHSTREFLRYLRIARASLAELESHTAFLLAAALVPAVEAEAIETRRRHVQRLLTGLVRSLETPRT
jgi:four helix bundle protein